VLEIVARAFECMIPRAVYQEAVVNARAKGYADAEAIDKAVNALMQIRDVASAELSTIPKGLGSGESEAPSLAIQQGEDSVIVSDDLVFLNAVQQREIRYLTPIELLPWLARSAIISVGRARELIESFRPLTNERNYLAALADLETSGK